MLRPGLTYYFNENIRFYAGYAFAHHYSDGGHLSKNEHRPWQQILWRQKHNGYATLQWLRLEQRFNKKEVNKTLVNTFNYRLRYNFSLSIPLKGKELNDKTPFISIIDEVFINMGDQIVYNVFDQNRFFLGFGYQVNSHLSAQLGYLNVFQQQAAGNKFLNIHAIRLFVFQSFDLRKNEETPETK